MEQQRPQISKVWLRLALLAARLMPRFRELLTLAVQAVREADKATLTSAEQRRAVAVTSLRERARDRGMDPETMAINLAIELAFSAVKMGLEWLLGKASLTVRLVAMLVLLAAACAGDLPAAGFANRNQSCASVMCDPGATVRLYCTTDTVAPFLGPAASGTCKACEGSTFNAAKCGSTGTTVTSTTRPPTTTIPGQPSTTVVSTTRPSTTTIPPTTTTTLPPAGQVTGPIRPSPRDRSIKTTPKRPDDLRWVSLGTMPRTASQPERDFYEHQRVLDASQFTMAVQAIPACKSAVGKCYTHLSGVVGKLGGEYEDRGLCRGNVWDVPADGRHYSFTRYCLEAIRACLLSAPTECAGAFSGNRPLLDELDMDVQGGRCVAGTPWTFGPLPTFDPRVEDLAPVDTRAPMPRPTAAELAKLNATHVAHNRGCLQACGEAVDESMVSAQIAHVQYEAACFTRPGTYTQKLSRLHFCQMKPFVGSMHPRWSPAERCDWCKVQHAFHMRWAAAQEAGDWGATRKADTDHFTSHLCANDGDDRMNAIFSCAEKPCNPLQCPVGEKRGRATCREYLPVLKARLGIP